MTRKLLELLNKAIEHHLQVSVQYLWQRIMVEGVDGAAIKNLLGGAATTEMKNAEALAERVVLLDGVPTNVASPVHIGHSLEEMLKENVQAEEESIRILKEAIQVADNEGDYGSRRLLEEILMNEEKQLDMFGRLLVGMTSPFTQPQL